MEQKQGKFNWLLLVVFLLIAGGLVGLTVFAATELSLHVALALSALFAALGGVAYTFFLTDGGRGWRWLAGLDWFGAILIALIYVTVEGWLHPALTVASILFAAAGMLYYLINRSKDADARALNNRVKWEKLGRVPERADEDLEPWERDVPQPHEGMDAA